MVYIHHTRGESHHLELIFSEIKCQYYFLFVSKKFLFSRSHMLLPTLPKCAAIHIYPLICCRRWDKQ